MMQSMPKLVALFATALMAVGCGVERSTSILVPTTIEPSSTGIAPSDPFAAAAASAQTSSPSLVGTWARAGTFSAQAITSLPDPNSCTEFQFTMISQTPTAATGSFHARCPGDVTLTGTATGQLGGATIPMLFTGFATANGAPACPFTLNGVGVLQSATELRIDFTGTSCLGPVGGKVTLRLSPPTPPAPPPPPPPPPPAQQPAPPPPPQATAPADPLLGCGSLVNGGNPIKTIECIHGRLNAPRTVEGAFEITKRVAWAYRHEGVGLLLKPGGENIVSWKGYSFSAARVCLPNGQIYKILTDVPTTNGPSLQDNGFVDPKLYMRAIDPAS
jgi:hypothetical protein